MDTFTQVATARAAAQQKRIEEQLNQGSIRYVFAPLFDMICEPLATVIAKGAIVPVSEQGQPIGSVYVQTLMGPNDVWDPAKYDMRGEIGEVPINPAPIVDALLSQYGPQGAVQVKSLFNLEIGKFLDAGLNDLIFEGKEYDTAAAYLERFELVRESAGGNSTFAQLLKRVLTELDASVNISLAWAKQKAEWSNQALKSGDLKKFSPYEHRLFKFSGVTPIDEAMSQVAVNQGALANALPKVVSDLKDAVVESRPDWKEISAGIAAGVKEGVKEAIAAVQTQQPAAKEDADSAAAKEAPKPARQGGNNNQNRAN
jgi:hypothetical protein